MKWISNPIRIVLVDDDLPAAESCALRLTDEGHHVEIFTSLAEAVNRLITHGDGVFVCLSDSVHDWDRKQLRELLFSLTHGKDASTKEGVQGVLVLVEDEASGAKSIENGADDFRVKPTGFDAISLSLLQLCRRKELERENQEYKQNLLADQGWDQIIATGQLMKSLLEKMKRAASTNSSILLVGEDGTGKELLARAVHHSGQRALLPFAVLDLELHDTKRAIAEFHHIREKLSPQGPAVSDKQKTGGTIYLNCLDTLSDDAQDQLLKNLKTVQEKDNIRFIVSSRKHLREDEFHGELLYLLGGIRLVVPPLRDRPEDIPALVKYFQAMNPAGEGKRFQAKAWQVMQAYGWPGNVEELKNFVDRALVMANGDTIDVIDLPSFEGQSKKGTRPSFEVPESADQLKQVKQRLREEAVRDVEEAFLHQALNTTDWNITRAAASVEMQRSNFHAMMRKYGLSRKKKS